MRRLKIILVLGLMLILPVAALGGQNLFIKGKEAQKAGNNEAAAKLLGEYLKRYPQMGEARCYYALALAELGRRDEALKQLDQGLAQDHQDIQLLLAKGNLLAKMERRAEAIEVYSLALKCDPKNAEVLKERGECQAQEGCFPEAMADLNLAAQLTPKDPWVYNKRGLVWFCQGEYQKAVADFSTAIRLAPDSPHPYFFRANMYRFHLGEREKAVADYRMGCKLGSTLCCGELEKMGVKTAGE
jgi:tetratricopeptide (TPR) repeat protein